ncbi:restriction endonuclease subunit S [uncultured Alistipes sp.]|uniref:restriction endonuclease subunit S n=2 Tax=uncultured Alistipes sp. TaxID=538949 RepID=UPI0026F29614|nr:restriction endonuclease subunit S [uncultured Alistipes sp.]
MAANKNNKALNVPPLRFPEFTGEWEKCSLGEQCSILMCKRILAAQTNQESGVPFYKIGTIGNTPNAYISKELFDSYKYKYSFPRKGEIMITCAGTVGKCIVFNGEDSYFQDSNIVWIDNPTEKIQNSFLYYVLSNVNWRKLNSTTITRIYNDDLRNLNIAYPSTTEQTIISSLLSLIDERIATQNKIIEKLETLIKGIVDLSYDNSATTKKLGNVIAQISQRNKSGKEMVVLSVNNKQGFIEQSEQFEERIIASDDTSNYKMVCINDFAYNPARINVGSIARLKDKECGIVSPMYICFRTLGNMLPEYLELFFKTKQFALDVDKRLEGSVRLCLSYEGLCEIAIPIIAIEKQKTLVEKIASLYSKLDIEKKFLRNYKMQKQYLLSQMFI